MTTLGAILFPRSASSYLFGIECFMWLECVMAPSSAKKTYYSKFASFATSKGLQLSGRQGMLCIYSPSAIAATIFLVSRLGYIGIPALLESFGLTTLASFLQYQETSLRVWLMGVVFVVHFWKRVLEVSFLHKFSNKVDFVTAFMISFHYSAATVHVLYAQYLSQDLPSPALDLSTLGVILYIVGILGNFYHHVLLARLRKGADAKYVIPTGGWFEWVVCPHYTFEVLEFWGWAMISQTYVALAAASNTTLYLAMRSRITREWYMEKIDDFPKSRKCLIPLVF